MAAQYKSVALFGSGPHRFSVPTQGDVVLSDLSVGTSDGNTFAVGVRELDVVVTGRLAAANDAALWTLREALASEVRYPVEPGLLEDDHGKQWANMTLIGLEWDPQTDRGGWCRSGTWRRFGGLGRSMQHKPRSDI